MSEFTIECTKCGSLHEVKSFWGIHKKSIVCATCGEEIRINENRFISKKCPECGKVFVYDQKKGGERLCPSCHKPINATKASTAHYELEKVSCPQCSCQIEVDSTEKEAECPVCGMRFDAKAAIAKSKLVSDSGVSIIKYEGDNQTLVWKHPIEDFNLGSQLIVHESQEAIFFLNGQALDTFGAGRHTLSTENIPLLRNLYSMPTGGQTAFHAEVYFVNTAAIIGMHWGVGGVELIEPVTGAPIAIGASGEANLLVTDSRKLLIKLIGTQDKLVVDSSEEKTAALSRLFRAPIQTKVAAQLAGIIKQNNIDILEISTYLGTLSDSLGEVVSPVFEEYGMKVTHFYVQTINTDEKNLKRIRELRTKKTLEMQEIAAAREVAKAAAEAKAEVGNIERQFERENEAADTRVKGFAEADVMRAKGYTEKDLIEADVQKAFAQGMGQMGSHGGSVGGGVASDMVSMMAGMKMAGNMMDRMDGMMGGSQRSENAGTWICSCGEDKNVGAFCMRCGKPKEAEKPAKDTWDCTCGAKGITSRFCPDCGKPKAEGWDCECGTKGIMSRFCPDCGKPKPESWDCTNCGTKGITSKFCPECGSKKEN